MMHPAPERLAGARDPEILAHIAECDECRSIVATLGKVKTAPRPEPKISRFSRKAVAAVWFVAMTAGFLAPIAPSQPAPESQTPPQSSRTYLHIDFSTPGHFELTDGELKQVRLGDRRLTLANATQPAEGWSAVSVRLDEPLQVGENCTLKIHFSTNAGAVVATLFRSEHDPGIILIEPSGEDLHTVVARIRASDAGLSPGDRVQELVLAAAPGPRGKRPNMLVKAIELRSD